MKHVYRKLKSERGASLAFALLIFVLCILAGTVALAAASANAGRYTHLEEEQRQYFSIASALDLLQAAMDDYTIEVDATYTEIESWEYVDPDGDGEYELHTDDPVYTLTLNPELDPTKVQYYETLLYRNCVPDQWWTNVAPSGPSKPASPSPTSLDKEYTIKPPAGFESSLYPVKVEVTGGADTGNYALEMRLEIEGGAYPIKVVWTAEPEITTATPDVKVENTPDGLGGKRTTTTKITCTLRWKVENRVVTFGSD